MDQPTPIILSVYTPEYKKVVIEANNGVRYQADLAALSGVYCFPKNLEEWEKVSIDSYGLSLIWSSRFEAHIDQVIGLSTSIEKTSEQQITP